MKFRNRPPRLTRFSVLLLITMATLALFAGEAAAFLHRVGPRTPPPRSATSRRGTRTTPASRWSSAIRRTSANSPAAGACLPPMLQGLPGFSRSPRSFPTNFFDEHFYYSTSAVWPNHHPAQQQLLWEAAVEAAFSTGGPVPGAQITFARIRVRLEDVPGRPARTGSSILTVKRTSMASAGDRIFFTDDVGVAARRLQRRDGIAPGPVPAAFRHSRWRGNAPADRGESDPGFRSRALPTGCSLRRRIREREVVHRRSRPPRAGHRQPLG